MKRPQYFSLVIAPTTIHVHGAVWTKHIFCGLFILLMALYCTRPSGTPASALQWGASAQDAVDMNSVTPCDFDCHLGLDGQ